MGLVARDQADYERARAHYEQSLAVAREAGLKSQIAHVLNDLGYVSYLEGDCRTARERLEESLRMSREAKDDYMAGWSLAHRGEVADVEGDHTAASAFLAEAMAIWRSWGSKPFMARVMRLQARVAHHRGDSGAALAHFREALFLLRELGWRPDVAACLEGMAGLALVQQQEERSARLFGAAAALREAIGCPLPPVERAEHDRHVSAVRSALQETEFAAAWSAGQVMSLEQALAFALEEGANA
jgi:tetratricopeptide (TPR) repeat protein